MWTRIALGLVLVSTFAACDDDGGEPLTKSQAENRAAGGDTTDYCSAYGWYGDGECETWCPVIDPDCSYPGCEPIDCFLACDHYKTDATGCPVCECEPAPTCEPILCTLFCEYGFVRDADGCEVCECATAPIQCSGFGGLICPGGLSCVDDPRDECDPNNGADCGGLCVPTVACGGYVGAVCSAGMTCVDIVDDGCVPPIMAECPATCMPLQL